MDSGEGKGEMSKLKTNSGYEIAFSTNVGSHMWKMNHENSDTDVFECYFLPTREILMGRLPNSHFSQDKENKVDTQVQEISKVTAEIIKSNINYIGYVFSPIVLHEESNFLTEYRKLAIKVISKQVYNSVRGMAEHNVRKYEKEMGEGQTPLMEERKWNKILRVIQFGIHLMRNGEIDFAPVKSGSADVYTASMIALEYTRKNGALQETPYQEDVDNLWDFVVEERIKRLPQRGSE